MEKAKQFSQVPIESITRNTSILEKETGNLYESVAIISKRGNQIATEMKEELHEKLSEFNTSTDNLEEVFENSEQIELSRCYEKLPKPSLIAIQDFLDGKVYHRNPEREAKQVNHSEE